MRPSVESQNFSNETLKNNISEGAQVTPIKLPEPSANSSFSDEPSDFVCEEVKNDASNKN
jgi:hypothetical protein